MRWIIIAAITAIALFAWALSRVSPDAVAMAIGMLLGVLAGVTPTMLNLLLRRDNDAPTTYIVLAAPNDSAHGYIDGEVQR